MKIGYARVSTTEQHIEMQIDALEKEGCEKIYEEKMSAGKERPVLKECLNYLREGDVFVVWKLDRLGRSLIDLVNTVNQFKDLGIEFIVIREKIDTSTPPGKLFFHMSAAFAEYERNIIRERTNAGLKAARARGRMGGRKPTLTPEKFKTAKELYNQNCMQVKDICRQLGINSGTFYKYMREEKKYARACKFVELAKANEMSLTDFIMSRGKFEKELVIIEVPRMDLMSCEKLAKKYKHLKLDEIRKCFYRIRKKKSELN